MDKRFKRLRKPLILAAVVIWIGYVFLANGAGAGVMTMMFLLLMITAMNIEF
ncbi:hypothetical protein [endosymbiont of Ridgeia piscesae]|jgi:hypothetical protein|uniref:Uncharacterized protein n=1 Tax=endosymbiont of Ridgeia piscesae TaxID=54398 RepID=A0A0T5Z2R6_9GAMM|nr:hypothetical protein [endosymbiont of Ridgeia piscesae]KRT54991.1 hypothetical protein Ga0074115_11246 [endosymbiont of Ridgeia piscesae]KRT56977.1 hypothetical protein Ga0076813_10746 [endosymbiont of Ridgeia piscesae]